MPSSAARYLAEPNPLLRPIRLGTLILPHRIVMAPMTRCRAGHDGVPTTLAGLYYRQRASAALIITEATQVSAEGIGYVDTPGIYTARQVSGWRRIVDAVHADQGRIFLQLWHVGRISHPDFLDGARPVAPSPVRPAGEILTRNGPREFVEPRALKPDEISWVVEDFRRGAAFALAAGFDGVEVHAANGYLLDQFLRDGTNLRTDRFGGSIENRLRFPLAVVDAVADVWGGDRVGVRVSPLSRFNDMADSRPDLLFTALARALRDRRLAYLHVVTENDFAGESVSFDPLSLRSAFGGPVIAAAGYDPESAAREVAAGRADLVAFGRSFLANPDLPRRIAESAPLNEADPGTFYGGDARGYTDYPAMEDGR